MNKDDDPAIKRPKYNSFASSIGHSFTQSVSKFSKFSKIVFDLFLLFCITVMLVWPWVFFGVVWVKNGIQVPSNRVANFITSHPQRITFFVTFIGTIIRTAAGFLFSSAVLRYSQECIMEGQPNLFHLSVISGFRNQKLPWGLGDLWGFLPRSSKWLRLALVVFCWGIFIVVPSSTTSLLGPAPFNKIAQFEGQELDFSSTAADCIDWLSDQMIPTDQCDWETYNGTSITTCLGENQLVDILESGRGNILSLITDNSQSLDFSQLGGLNGLRFLGPIRGVLPMGPNGVPAFNTLPPSLVSDQKKAGILSYNYTLQTQGINSTVSCEYSSQSPINYAVVANTNNYEIQYDGNCSQLGQAEALTDILQLLSPNSLHALTFWACKSLPSAQELSYFIYLRGLNNYETGIGNITCTISPIQPAIFPLTYQSIPDIFSLGNPSIVGASNFSGLLDQAIVALGAVISEGQSTQANIVAESVITFGIKSFNLPEDQQDPEYLQLYEAMIQGIVEYLASYIRMLTSTGLDRPDSCNRTVDMMLSYKVLGWSMKPEHIGYLIPLTVVNLASLVIMIFAILGVNGGVSHCADPTDPRTLVLAEHRFDEKDHSGWKDRVRYRDRSTVVPVVPVVEPKDKV